jgi:hypothetical protein
MAHTNTFWSAKSYNRQRGENVTSSDLKTAEERKSIYAKWLGETVLGMGFKVLMVHPVGDYEPFYRDVYRP